MTELHGKEARPHTGAGAPPVSRQVSWFETFRYAEGFAAHHGLALDPHLIAGTPRWCELRDDDARKLLALVLGGVRDALHNDTEQQHRSEASYEIANAEDWTAVARRVQTGRGAAYIPRKAAS